MQLIEKSDRPRPTSSSTPTPALSCFLTASKHLSSPPPPTHTQPSQQPTPLLLLLLLPPSQLKARVSELEAELEKLHYRVERLGCSLREGDAAARRALEEVGNGGGEGREGGLRSRLGRVLFGKYYYEEGGGGPGQ